MSHLSNISGAHFSLSVMWSYVTVRDHGDIV